MLGVPKIDDVWRAIDYEVSLLHGRWIIYRQLYGTDEGRIDVLNHAAGTFAHMLQEVLLDSVQLGLAKLGDPATIRVRSSAVENLTLANLCELITSSGELIIDLPPLLTSYNTACTKIRKRRHKRIAHFDLETMLKPKASLQDPSRAEIEAALKALRNVMDCISFHYTGTRTDYAITILHGDGESLIAMLKGGLRYWEMVKDGAISVDDLCAHDWG